LISLSVRIANRLKDLLFLPPFDSFWLRARAGTVTSLVYHRVGDSDLTRFLSEGGTPVIEPEALHRELAHLKGQGVRFMTYRDLREGEWPSGGEIGGIVTFDDGFRDNYVEGLSVLNALDVKAVFFQSTALVEGRTLIWEHALYWLAAQPKLRDGFHRLAGSRFEGLPGITEDWVGWLRGRTAVSAVEGLLADAITRFEVAEELTELAERIYPREEAVRAAAVFGHEIGSHGHRHYPRSGIDAATFEAELATSASELERILGRPAQAYSYPFGSVMAGDDEITARYFEQAAVVDGRTMERGFSAMRMSRCSWPGPQPNPLRERRWLMSGGV